MTIDLDMIAEELDCAAATATAIPQISGRFPAFDLDQAWQVQRKLIDLRLDRGETVIGIKMGFTSRAKMLQMGVSDLIWGRLTDKMLVENGGAIAFDEYVHPRVEPEIAFRLAKPLSGNISCEEAWDAIGAIAPALEIIDSRYENFKFSLADVVADNSSSSRFVIGPWREEHFDISNLGMVLNINGKPKQFGSTAAILDHPIHSLVAAARKAAEAGIELQAGWIILCGATTSAEALSPGDFVQLEAQNLASVDLYATGVQK